MRYLLLISFLYCLPASAFAQSGGQTIRVPAAYEFSKKKPIEAQAGDVIENECAELFLLNRERFEFYEELRATVPILDSLEKHILFLDNKITEKEQAFDALAEQCQESTSLNAELEERLSGIVGGMDTALAQTNSNLIEANKSLEEANKLMKRSRRSKIWERCLIGAGGVIVGTLGTLVLRN